MNTPGTALRTLRRRVFNEGLQVTDDSLSSSVAASWQRCVQIGLNPFEKKIPENILPNHILRIRQEQRQDLIAMVSPSMDYLRSLIAGSGSVIVLADVQGVIIHSVGDSAFLSKADSVLLKPGASWREQHRGTNAVGTALVENAPVSINGSEHYFDKHGFLSCTAAPIRDSKGALIGVLDISSDYRTHHPHTLGLVKTTVDQVEKQWLFKDKPAGAIVLSLHPQASALGTLAEGILFLDEAGTILSCNAQAAFWLGISSLNTHGKNSISEHFKVQQILNITWSRLLDRSLQYSTQQFECKCFDGKPYCVRLDFSDFRMHHGNSLGSDSPSASALDLREKMRSMAELTLRECAGNVTQAAKLLGISRTTLYRYLQQQEDKTLDSSPLN